MAIATGAISLLVPKLTELSMEEYKLPKGVRRDIKELRDEMVTFQAVLRRAAKAPLDQQSLQVRQWAKEVKELSWSTYDVVDSFLVDSELSKAANLDDFKGRIDKVGNMFKKGKAQRVLADAQRVLADAIKDCMSQVRELKKIQDTYKLHDDVAYSAPVTIDPRLLALYQDHEDIVGIEESSKDLIDKILRRGDYSSKQQLRILSIVGCMGLGKTTLAKAVYDKLRGDFVCSAYVSVGRQPKMKRTLRDLLFEVGAGRYHQDASTLELVGALQTPLMDKRCLIVVDDIWDIRSWDIIRATFVDDNCGSLVIITTRNLDVAQRAGEVYKLKPLSPEKSEVLFYKRLFGGKDKISDHHLAEVTKSIIKKCDCIPLAIITMASLLACIPRQEWSLVYNSIGFGHRDDGVVEMTRKICLFSYYDIPSELRTCLLHLSIFPEGYMIRKDTLIWKWIAEGFIRKEHRAGLFEVGERYFNVLISKSLVQPVKIPHSGIIIGCRVNVMVLDMICFLSKEENFVTVLDSHKEDTSHRRQARLLAIQNRVVQENEMVANPHVRSFYATQCGFRMMPSLTTFQRLRVLALEDCASTGGIYHLEHITILVHLMYLGLLKTPIYELPEGIGNLIFLQTLDLRQTKIEDLPVGIVLLTQLKCLRTDSRSIRVPDGMGNLASLEELQLSDVSISPNIVKELGNLTELRDLKLWIRLSNERSKRDLVESLGNLQKIEILHLDGGLWIEESCWEGYVPSLHLRHVFFGMKFSRLPAWINPSLLPNLSHLSVDVNVVEEEDLVVLGGFPELLSLSLAGEYVCLPDIMAGGAFPRLMYCYTSGMVRFLNGAAPRLEFVSFNVRLWGSKDGSFDLEFRSLLENRLLQEVRVEIFYTEAHVTEVDKVEAALSNVVDVHPNRPILDISKWKSSVSEQFGSHDDVDGNEYYDDNEEDNDHEYYYDEE